MGLVIVTDEKIYKIGGLTILDMELLSLALHELKGDLEQPKLDRAANLIQAVDYVLQAK